LLFSKEEEDICVCNRPKNDHHEKDPDTKEAKWDMLHNTYEEINPAFGQIFNDAWV
jgi:hypothetical protein